MRILMCTHHPLDRKLGGPKVSIELAEAMRELGAHCELAAPGDFGASSAQDAVSRVELTVRLRDFLIRRAGEFDVVEYDHEDLPFERSHFAPSTLMVARSALLVHHLDTISIPQPAGPRAIAGRLLHGRQRRELLKQRIEQATRTVQQADLVNVSNDRDKSELVRRGVDAERVIVMPYGLSAQRRAQFQQACLEDTPPQPMIGFVGTFDYRKGAFDFPKLARLICDAVPDARFKLLGTAGLFPTFEQVLDFFPRDLHQGIEVQPTFEPDDLPQLLADCSAGVYPSYYEGFGFGVLEMLAAAMPVVAYDAPGPPMTLPPEWLVRPGDVEAMSSKIIHMLRNTCELAESRRRARAISQRFDWSDIARHTIAAYESAIARRGNRRQHIA